MMYSLDEVSIIPSTFTSVKSRKDIITTYTSKLPIFVAPMTCLVDFINFSSFEDSKVIPILPVYDINNKELFKQRLTFIQQSKWVALTLNEFEDTFCRNKWNLDKENLFISKSSLIIFFISTSNFCKSSSEKGFSTSKS